MMNVILVSLQCHFKATRQPQLNRGIDWLISGQAVTSSVGYIGDHWATLPDFGKEKKKKQVTGVINVNGSAAAKREK